MRQIQNVSIKNANCTAAVYEKICMIVERQIRERTSGLPSRNTVEITLSENKNIGKEGFVIESDRKSRYDVSGNDDLGLFYGIGHLLHKGSFKGGDFIPGDCAGKSLPEKAVRGMYIANPGWNYYGRIGIEELGWYIEDLLLWGCNTIMVVAPPPSREDKAECRPEFTAYCADRSKAIIKLAREVGMVVVVLTTANLSFTPPPDELLADWTGGHDGYTRNLAAHMHVEICPSKPGGLDYILQGQQEVFSHYLDAPPDYFCLWPYDAGGCTCSGCKPWGGNGFLKVAKAISGLLAGMFPNTGIMLSAWLFDDFTTGEWDALDNELAVDKSWLDYLMVHFSLEAGIPACVGKSGRMPGSLPAVDFPEISMYACVPWGGFGANPIPARLQKMWDSVRGYLDGGYPYSEGIFDDLNKVICLKLYWGGMSADEIVRQYSAYEFGAEVARDIAEAIGLIELATGHTRVDETGSQHVYPDPLVPWIGEQRFLIEDTSGIDRAYEIMTACDSKLPVGVQKSWRWKILYLRAVCDYELFHNGFKTTDRCEKALHELTRIYHAESVPYHLAPPTRESIREARGIFTI